MNRKTRARGGRPTPLRTRREIFEEVKKATVALGFFDTQLRNMSVVGTGVCIDPAGVILTAKHVLDARTPGVQPGELPHVCFIEPGEAGIQTQGYRVPIFSHADQLDLALLRIVPDAPDLPYLRVDTTADYWEGEELAVCGFPLGMSLHQRMILTSSFSAAMVSAVLPSPVAPVDRKFQIQLDGMINPGNSGGPLFRPTDGTVVGVVTSIRGNTTFEPDTLVPTGIAWATPARWVDGMVEKLKAQKFGRKPGTRKVELRDSPTVDDDEFGPHPIAE